MNTASILGGPALVQYRGASFYSKGNITITNSKTLFNVETDRFGIVDERVSEEAITVSFEPAGEFENLSVLWPYASTLPGTLITPRQILISAIDTTTNVLTSTAHGLATADDVLVHVETGGTLPTATPALTQTTRYYVRAVSADTVKLYTSASDASADTSAIDFTVVGTGNFYVDRDHPLVIHTFAGIKLTLYNAAVTQMPGLRLSATQSLIAPVTFEAFLRNGTDWDNAAARWALSAAALSDTTFDPAAIITQPYTAAWGSAPWDSFVTKEGWNVNFATNLAPVMTDGLGILTRRLTSIDVSASATPLGFSETQILQKLLLQDTGAKRGRSPGGDNLNLSGTGVYVRLYRAGLRSGTMNFSAALERTGQMDWFASRSFSAGAPDPLFYIGAAAP